MKPILYDELTVSIFGVNKLTKEDQRDLRRLFRKYIRTEIRFFIESYLLPEHLKNKVKVVIQ